MLNIGQHFAKLWKKNIVRHFWRTVYSLEILTIQSLLRSNANVITEKCRNSTIQVPIPHHMSSFLSRVAAMLARYWGSQFCASVRPSVIRVLCGETKERTADILIPVPYERTITLVYWYQHSLGRDLPFHLKFAVKMTHLLWKTPTSTNICL